MRHCKVIPSRWRSSTKYNQLAERERQAQLEIKNVAETLKTSFGMMSHAEQCNFVRKLTAVLQQVVKRELELTEAIRDLLESNQKEWFSAVKVRENLKASGFDFLGYASNPLAFVRAVLERFKPTEVQTRRSGIKTYRWIKPGIPPDLELPPDV